MSYFDDYIATGVNCCECHDHIGMDVGHTRTCTACTPAVLASQPAKTATQKRNARKRKALKNLRIAKALARALETPTPDQQAARDRVERTLATGEPE